MGGWNQYQSSFSGLSTSEIKKEKARQAVRDSRWRNKQEEDKLKAEKQFLQEEMARLKHGIAMGQSKNAVWGHVARTMSQANSGLNNHPAMQAMLNNTTNPAWKSYDPAKSWKENRNMKWIPYSYKIILW